MNFPNLLNGQIKFNFDKIINLLLIYVSFILFSFLYRDYISDIYSYYGFKYYQITILESFITLLLLSIPIFIFKSFVTLPSQYSLWILYILVYFPSCIIGFYFNQGQNFFYSIFPSISVLLGLIILNYFSGISTRIHFRSIYINKKILNRIIYFSLFLLISFLMAINGFQINLSFSNLYDRREIITSSSSLIVKYIFLQIKGLAYPFLVYMTLKFKNIFPFSLLIFFSLYLFSYEGSKNSLLLPVFMFLIGLIVISSKQRIRYLISFVFLLMLFSSIEYYIFDSKVLVEVLVRRAFAVQGYLNHAYFEFFSNNKLVYFTDSFGSLFKEPVYNLKLTYLIGDKYLTGHTFNANSNIWSGWFAHLGFAGVVLASIVSGLILGFIDRCSNQGDYVFCCMVSIFFGIKWSEQFLHTSFFSGGIAILMLMIYFYSPKTKSTI